MDIFGKKSKKRQAELERNLSDMDHLLVKKNQQITELEKNYEGYKNRYRTFVVYPCIKGPTFQVKARRFEHNDNGYYFYEVDKTVANPFTRSSGAIVKQGQLVGHISSDYVWRVEEKPE